MAQGNTDFVQKILAAFLQHTPPALARLRAAAAAADWPTAAQVAHQLKPTLKLLAVTDTEEPIQQLEAHPRATPDARPAPTALAAAAATLAAQVEAAMEELGVMG